MSKVEVLYVCPSCGYTTHAPEGRCHLCGFENDPVYECCKCGSTRQPERTRGYPGEYVYRCLDCGNVEIDAVEKVYEWMI